MLVLTRKPGQVIHVGDSITITIVQVARIRVRIGIDAPMHVTVHRGEIYAQIRDEAQAGGATTAAALPGTRDRAPASMTILASGKAKSAQPDGLLDPANRGKVCRSCGLCTLRYGLKLVRSPQ